VTTTIGKVDCPSHCGGQAEVREAKGGTLTFFHQGCCQGFIKSPNSVKALRAYLAGEGPKPALPAPTTTGKEAERAAGTTAAEKYFF